MNTNGLATILESIEGTVKAELSLSDDQLEKIMSLPEGKLGKHIKKDFKIETDENGHGSIKWSGMTGGVTLHGFFKITSPTDGTWTIKVVVAGDTVVDEKNVSAGDQIRFKAKTNFWKPTSVEITVQWSEHKKTTLVVHMDAEY